jgi:hypothetical protein
MAKEDLVASAERIENDLRIMADGMLEIKEHLEEKYPVAFLEAAANIKEYMSILDSNFQAMGELARGIVEGANGEGD